MPDATKDYFYSLYTVFAIINWIAAKNQRLANAAFLQTGGFVTDQILKRRFSCPVKAGDKRARISDRYHRQAESPEDNAKGDKSKLFIS
jgi:hypothetical protein